LAPAGFIHGSNWRLANRTASGLAPYLPELMRLRMTLAMACVSSGDLPLVSAAMVRMT
jgi:hypothetical protein